MSFANPTPIRIGMTGTFCGNRYRVAGRVVMGMEEDGETYYWNEFNLVNTEGESATLVYEEGEHGGNGGCSPYLSPGTDDRRGSRARIASAIRSNWTAPLASRWWTNRAFITSKAKLRKAWRSATWRIISTPKPATGWWW